MGLRFGFGLPGPFSWSTNVFPRMPRGRIRKLPPESRPMISGTRQFFAAAGCVLLLMCLAAANGAPWLLVLVALVVIALAWAARAVRRDLARSTAFTEPDEGPAQHSDRR